MTNTPEDRTVAVTGASGLVGRELCAALARDGVRVRRLVRREPDRTRGEAGWDPDGGTIEPGALEGLSALVHLAGENIGRRRWSDAQKRRIRHSRVSGTELLSRTLLATTRPPSIWISASAIGYYGDRGGEPVDESAEPGSGFLAETAIAWEHATDPAAQAGIRVVTLRTGVVLSPRGGALARMLPPFRLGLGGRIGDGSQYMSWVGHRELIDIMRFAIQTPTVRGPVNAVAPGAVTNREFTRTLARVLRRPAIFPLPAFMVRLLLGEMGQALLLEGARVVPAALTASGYRFRQGELEACLRFELGRADR